MPKLLRPIALLAMCAAALAAVATVTVDGQTQTNGTTVTFTKDIAPILQRSCQNCHRPGQMAPMSLLTYQDVRPWVRSIKQRVLSREMPPWGIDPHVGIQSFKNDPSLRASTTSASAMWSASSCASRSAVSSCGRNSTIRIGSVPEAGSNRVSRVSGGAW